MRPTIMSQHSSGAHSTDSTLSTSCAPSSQSSKSGQSGYSSGCTSQSSGCPIIKTETKPYQLSLPVLSTQKIQTSQIQPQFQFEFQSPLESQAQAQAQSQRQTQTPMQVQREKHSENRFRNNNESSYGVIKMENSGTNNAANNYNKEKQKEKHAESSNLRFVVNGSNNLLRHSQLDEKECLIPVVESLTSLVSLPLLSACARETQGQTGGARQSGLPIHTTNTINTINTINAINTINTLNRLSAINALNLNLTNCNALSSTLSSFPLMSPVSYTNNAPTIIGDKPTVSNVDDVNINIILQQSQLQQLQQRCEQNEWGKRGTKTKTKDVEPNALDVLSNGASAVGTGYGGQVEQVIQPIKPPETRLDGNISTRPLFGAPRASVGDKKLLISRKMSQLGINFEITQSHALALLQSISQCQSQCQLQSQQLQPQPQAQPQAQLQSRLEAIHLIQIQESQVEIEIKLIDVLNNNNYKCYKQMIKIKVIDKIGINLVVRR